MEIYNAYVMPFIYLLVEMAPFLLFGLLFAGILHAFVPKKLYRQYLGRNSMQSVLCAIFFGIPLPLCSCGVIPTAVGMRKEGASKGATTAFLIATPQTGVDSILATYSIFGWGFALLRPFVAMITGFFGGLVTNMVSDSDSDTFADHDYINEEVGQMSLWKKCCNAFSYGFTDMLMDIGQWLLIGIVLAGIITIFVPDDFFLSYHGNYFINMILVLLIACPMYVCATGSIPIAAALMLKGISPGAALVFLMAGPATNMASIMVLGKTLGKKSLAAYLISIVSGAIVFGLIVDLLLPEEWFNGSMVHSFHSSCCHELTIPWWQVASTLVFLFLLVRALFLRQRKGECSCEECHNHSDNCHCGENHCHCHEDHLQDEEVNLHSTIRLQVSGMMCNHCKNHVQEALEHVVGVHEVSVDLASGIALVEGEATEDELINAVESCGYTCKIAE